MSQLIKWAVPDQYEVGPEPDARRVIIMKQSGGVGPFVQIDEINLTSDGNAKSDSNTWISEYEDYGGILEDFYQVAFKDATGRIGQFSMPGQGGYLSRAHEIMDLVRSDLGDTNPAFYQLDTAQYKWTGTDLFRWIKASINDFNGEGPMVTKYNIDTLPDDAVPVIEEAVKCRALFAKATQEVPNVLDYNDGVSFRITNRPGDYRQLKNDSCDAFLGRVKRWKQSHRPRSIGLGSQRLPFRVTRPLSMLPNMSNTFGL